MRSCDVKSWQLTAKLNGCSGFCSGSRGTLARPRGLLLTESEEDNMSKLGYVIAATVAVAVAAPSIASADTVVIKRGHHWDGARAEYRTHRDYGWHKPWWHHSDRDRVVIREHRY
jgi:hypothetical protein